ncbi:unnamed protein product, partial [Allacma fusca]
FSFGSIKNYPQLPSSQEFLQLVVLKVVQEQSGSPIFRSLLKLHFNNGNPVLYLHIQILRFKVFSYRDADTELTLADFHNSMDRINWASNDFTN